MRPLPTCQHMLSYAQMNVLVFLVVRCIVDDMPVPR